MKTMKDLWQITQIKWVKRLIFIIVDLFLLSASYALTVFLIHVYITPVEIVTYFIAIMVMIAIRMIAMVLSGSYQIIFKAFGIKDVFRITVSMIVSAVITFILMLYTTNVSVIEALLIFAFVSVSDTVLLSSYRILYRFYQEIFMMGRKGVKTLIIGAGDAGLMMAKNFNRKLSHHPVLFLDDDIDKKGQFLQGIKIEGSIDDLAIVLKNYDIQEIVIAIVSLNASKVKFIIETASKMNIPIRRLPSLEEMKSGSPLKLRNVEVEDLLERDEVTLNLDSIKEIIKNQTVMVTGGGGSIGSELCRQIASFHPKKLVIVDFYENNAYEIQMELERLYHYQTPFRLEVIIASVYNLKRMTTIFEKIHPDLVFHTAAYKHVPLMENANVEAIRTNVLGTYNIAKLSKEFNVKKMVLISSDKAVRPTNIMGATKRMAEIIIESMQKETDNTIYSAVRFGNVLNSNGSVVPLFKAQIESGGPVTVTDENVTRYFMTTKEAVGLILESTTFSKPGDVFVLDMGHPLKIMDLAKRLIQLSGYDPGSDIEIKVTGLRPGEKLYEELLMSEEARNNKTPHSKIFTEKINMKPLDFKALENVFSQLDQDSTFNYKTYLFELIGIKN